MPKFAPTNDELKNVVADVEALQNASNLSGVVNAFQEVLTVLKKNGIHNRDLHHHPLVMAVIGKIVDMTGFDKDRESAAYNALPAMMNGEEIEYE